MISIRDRFTQILDFIRREEEPIHALRYLVFRVGTRVLLGKKWRDKLLEAYVEKKLFEKMGLSRRTIEKIKWRITYVGWLGHGNLGDEALYQVNTKIFKPYFLIPEIGTPHYSKITLFGGGTLLPDYASIIKPNKYNYAYGIGVKNPLFWGEPNYSLINKIKKFNFRYLGVRDNASKKLLMSWGIESEVVGDPCLLLEPIRYEKKKKKETSKKIAINIGSIGPSWGGDKKRVLSQVARLCRILQRKGYYPTLIPFYKKDLHDIQRISAVTNTPIFKDWLNIQKVLDFIGSCHILIGEKLHSIVFSAATYTPFISIEYRPKCRDFAETMGFKKYVIRTDEITTEKIMVIFSDLLNNWNEMYEKLIENVEFYRKKLREFANSIKKDLMNVN